MDIKQLNDEIQKNFENIDKTLNEALERSKKIKLLEFPEFKVPKYVYSSIIGKYIDSETGEPKDE